MEPVKQPKTSSDEKYIHVNITSPEGDIYAHRSYGCRVHTIDGWLTILPDHLPIVTVLDIGAVIVTRLNDDQPDYIAINGGTLTFQNNTLDIAATYAIRARNIDEAHVKLMKNQAEADMQEALSKDKRSAYRRAQVRLNRAINQINVSAHRKHKR